MVRASKFYAGATEGKFISSLYDDVKTLYDVFRKGAKESSKYDDHVHRIKENCPCNDTNILAALVASYQNLLRQKFKNPSVMNIFRSRNTASS